ncbi:hypothetical protein SUDANB58_05786 (plasmid) [Streptomyces sp. enrichment culture]|uniref:hypothetical protein n=1 Tax=Streptomyces sp. enrichment culture TaxID=1795815 RepID=UPI003F569C68
MDATTYTDHEGRTLAERVVAVHRYGDPVTGEQRAAAEQLLTALLAATEQHEVTLEDLDAVVNLPGR